MSAHRDVPPRPPRLLPPAHSSRYLAVATLRDAAAIAALRNEVAAHLAGRDAGDGATGRSSERGVRFGMTRGVVYVRRERGRLVASLTLSRRKPWAIDPAYFTAARAPLYLTSMAVRPDRQRTGIGRRCMLEVRTLAKDWQADAVRLDAYDTASGAGGFYAACGMRETGRVVYRGTPLVYFEWTFG